MIIHQPFGKEHPYEQDPEERTPRHPLAGQPFAVGVGIRPPGAAQQVMVWHQVADAPPQAVAAIRDADWVARHEEGVGAEFLERLERVEQDLWHAELVAPAWGQTLRYWIEADGERSQDYPLRGEDWIAAALLDYPLDTTDWHLQPAQVELLSDGQHLRRLRLTFPSAADEAFYGLGERFNALNQKGEWLDIRCYEQYKDQGRRTYLPVPFLLSSRGYGVYVESARWMAFDLRAADHWTLEADLPADGHLTLTWFTDPDPYALIGRFTLHTGQPALPPLWAFGLWMSANEWNSQEKVLREVALTREHGIPASVLVIEAWSDETTFYIWNDAEYDPVAGDGALKLGDFRFGGKWPDPKGMVDQLHAEGIRVLLWQIPVLKAPEGEHPQHAADRAHFEAQGYGVRAAEGAALYRVRPFWFRDGYLLDVTHAEAVRWWLEKRAYLLGRTGH
ncbi:MAG: hypothetical protein HC915_15065 [Anaerolineae bacterium]|nr:hypothetical protein [Anaerolineae bacterium]